MGTVTRILADYGLIAVGLLIFFEDFGVPLPGETILIAASASAGQHHLDIFLVALVAVTAAVAGDNVGWLIGRYLGRRVVYLVACGLRVRGRYVLPPSRVRRGEEFLQRKGRWTIAVARFFDVFRQLNGILAGSLHVAWPVFLVFNIVGAVLWVGIWASVGYFVGSAAGADRVGRVILYLIGGAILLLAGGYLLRRLVRRLRHTPTEENVAEVEARICREERGEERSAGG